VLPSYDLAAITARLAGRDMPADAVTEQRQAAVAAVLRDGGAGGAEVLLIRRAEAPGDPWSGHMAFPGGRRDAVDPSLLATAVRETREEVGLDLDAHGKLLGRLPDVPAVARGKRVGLTIAPFVFALKSPAIPPFTLNDEVAEVLWTPLGPLARGERATTYPYVHDGQPFALPGFAVGERIVWGLTYRMLELFFDILHGT
jgi:8-oxo-dGTP pyrophosphatase MutT (NUDIX family)